MLRHCSISRRVSGFLSARNVPRYPIPRCNTTAPFSTRRFYSNARFVKAVNDYVDKKPAQAAVWCTIIFGVGSWVLAGLTFGGSIINNINTANVKKELLNFQEKVDGPEGSITVLRGASARIEQSLSRIKNVGRLALELGLLNAFPDQKLDRDRMDVIVEVYQRLKTDHALPKLCPEKTIIAMEQFVAALEQRAEAERLGKVSKFNDIRYMEKSE